VNTPWRGHGLWPTFKEVKRPARTIKLTRKTDRVTGNEFTAGTFDNAENRTEARQVYDNMTARF
jgi:hypothetical protein